MHIIFKNDSALVAFGSMGEGMEEVQRDCGENFEADQIADVVQSVWNEANPNPDGTISVAIDEGRRETVQSIIENLIDNEENEADAIAIVD